jgi:hypothetical protein
LKAIADGKMVKKWDGAKILSGKNWRVFEQLK